MYFLLAPVTALTIALLSPVVGGDDGSGVNTTLPYCVEVGGERYCNVTSPWKTRISEDDAVAAVVVPVTYVLVAWLALQCCSCSRVCSIIKGVKKNYKKNVKYINKHDSAARFLSSVTGNDNKAFRTTMMAASLICLPVFAIVWDMVDVATDSYYFQQMETGELLDGNISRNIHANNVAMTFATLGAFKSPLLGLAYCLSMVIYRYKKDKRKQLAFWLLVCIPIMKVLTQDGPGLLVQYFYMDKYITSTPPWGLLVKHVISTLIYILALLKLAGAFKRWDKYIIEKFGGAILMTVVFPILVVLTMMVRISGAIYHYSTGSISAECLQVTDTGTLVQTPFSAGCMNPADWMVIILLVMVLLYPIVLIGLMIYILMNFD